MVFGLRAPTPVHQSLASTFHACGLRIPEFRVPFMIRRFVWLSSTTRILTPCRDAAAALMPDSVVLSRACIRTVKRKLVPRPISLSNQILPPIIAANRADIVSPRPVPPYLRVVDESACVKGEKIDFCFSDG